MKSDQFSLHHEIELRHWWFRGRRRIVLSLIRSLVPPGQGRVLIDIGCGTGGNTFALAEEYAAVGVDPSPEAIAFAKTLPSSAVFIEGRFPADVGQKFLRAAEMFLLLDVLEHLADDAGLVAEVVSCLRPGGYLLLTVPAGMRLWSEHDRSFGHYRRYDLASLRALWAKQPVRELVVSYYNSRLYPVVLAARMLSRLRGGARGLAGTDFKMGNPGINAGLEQIFAGESRRLLEVLSGKRPQGYGRGVSLIAVLRREPGEIKIN